MDNIKIRYTFKRRMDGRTSQQILTIEELETNHFLQTLEISHDIVARELWIGLQDKEGADIYVGDTWEWAGGYKGEVVAEDGCFIFRTEGFSMSMRDHNSKEFTITGNIHNHIT